MKSKVGMRMLVCFGVGLLLSLAANGVMSHIVEAIGDTKGGMLSVVFELIYFVLIYFLVNKPINTRIGGSYGVIGSILCAVLAALALTWLTYCTNGSFILIIILALAYTVLLYAYAAKFEKK